MDHSDNDHGEHGGIHLPDPSIWPLVVGVAAFVMGAALIYYARDRDADFAGPLLGAAAIVALISGCGWAYEDGRMKRKAEEGLITKERNARYTQVVTFALGEGQYAAAHGQQGILTLLQATDSDLRNLDGFQDIRVIAAPAETGPSQVIVETTWADREGLASYEETRTTMLDLLAQHSEEVVSGSVQVFDMEVIRDTKDTSFNFGTGAMVGTFASLIAGGFMVGAGLNLFASDAEGGTAVEGGNGGDPANLIAARNTRYISGTTIEAPPNTDVTLIFDNREAQPHNVQVFAGSSAGGSLLGGCKAGCDPGEDGNVYTELKTGPFREEFTFTTPAAGEYAFSCAAHPTMVGKIVIKADAPVPGAPAAPAAGISPAAGTSPAASPAAR